MNIFNFKWKKDKRSKKLNSGMKQNKYKYELDNSLTILEAIRTIENQSYDENIFFLKNSYIERGTNIGKFSYVGENSKVDFGTTIGKYCSIANNVLIGATIHPQKWLSTSPFQYDTWLDPSSKKKYWQIYKSTIIGNDVWIGANSVIKSGVKVGDGSIIGAGAVVTKNVPPYSIVAGVPAKVIKYRFDDKTIEKLLEIKWWNLPHEEIVKLDYENVEKVIEVLSK